MSRRAGLATLACAAALAACVPPAALSRAAHAPSPLAHALLPLSPRARAAHVLKASDTARLRYLKASGSLLIEEGRAEGGLPGTMHARIDIQATFTGSFTIYAKGGTIEGHGQATPHGEGKYESFAGTLVVTGGSGAYAHAHGRAGLYGTFDRDNYGFVVQTTGTLVY